MKKVIKLTILLALISVFSMTAVSQSNNSKESKKDFENCFVILKVEFLKTGKVGKVSVSKDTCPKESELYKKAIQAVKKVKFKPTMKNGKAKTVTKKVKYTFQVIEDDNDKKSTNSLVNKPLKILYKPQPKYPKDSGTICVQGTVMLRIEYLANGEIGKIFVVKGLPYGLTQSAIEAARKIEFEPKIENGVPVTETKRTLFGFSLY